LENSENETLTPIQENSADEIQLSSSEDSVDIEELPREESPESLMTITKSSLQEKDPFTILVEGNIGSGKSSFLKIIQESNPDEVDIVPEPIEKWQDCNGVNLLQQMYEDPKKNSFAFQTYVQLTKVELHRTATNKPYRIMERSLLSARYCFIENLLRNEMITTSEYAVSCTSEQPRMFRLNESQSEEELKKERYH